MGTDKNSKKEYGSYYREHYFEQYKLYLEGIEKISNRRENAKRYFLTVNTGIFLAIGFLITNSEEKTVFLPLIQGGLFVGLLISIIFIFLINSYKQLNTGKFEVLHQIEKELPLNLYSREWKVLGEGKDYKKYYPFSHIEKIIPIVFALIYALLFLISLFCL